MRETACLSEERSARLVWVRRIMSHPRQQTKSKHGARKAPATFIEPPARSRTAEPGPGDCRGCAQIRVAHLRSAARPHCICT